MKTWDLKLENIRTHKDTGKHKEIWMGETRSNQIKEKA